MTCQGSTLKVKVETMQRYSPYAQYIPSLRGSRQPPASSVPGPEAICMLCQPLWPQQKCMYDVCVCAGRFLTSDQKTFFFFTSKSKTIQ